MEASRKQFTCANPEKSGKTMEVLKDIISEQDSKLDFEKHRARPLPSFLVVQKILTGRINLQIAIFEMCSFATS